MSTGVATSPHSIDLYFLPPFGSYFPLPDFSKCRSYRRLGDRGFQVVLSWYSDGVASKNVASVTELLIIDESQRKGTAHVDTT